MATTISDSSTTASPPATQKVDYISALNAGSGLNTTQIVDTLVDAEVLPKQNKINEQVAEKKCFNFKPRTSKEQFHNL